MFGRVFLPNGKPTEIGDIFRNPDMGHALKLIAEQGPAAFDKGEIAAERTRHWSSARGHRFSSSVSPMAYHESRSSTLPVTTPERAALVEQTTPEFRGDLEQIGRAHV